VTGVAGLPPSGRAAGPNAPKRLTPDLHVQP